jgi:N-acyl-L-homoserine lactone synthetase
MSPDTSSSPAEATGSGVAALDRLAERLLAAVAPLRVDVARDVHELEAVFRLRYEHVVAEGWARAEQLPEGLERDAYDDDGATQIAAWDGEALVGTLRLVLPVEGRRLPVEAAFDVDISPRGRVVDVGRLLIAERHRGEPAHRLWGALFARCWLEARTAGFTVLGGTATAAMVERYRALGLAFEILGPAQAYWGEERHPVRLDPDAGSRPSWF